MDFKWYKKIVLKVFLYSYGIYCLNVGKLIIIIRASESVIYYVIALALTTYMYSVIIIMF